MLRPSLGASASTESLAGERIDTSFFAHAPAQTDAAIVELDRVRPTPDSVPL